MHLKSLLEDQEVKSQQEAAGQIWEVIQTDQFDYCFKLRLLLMSSWQLLMLIG